MTVVQERPKGIEETPNSTIEDSPHADTSNEAVFTVGFSYIALPCLIFLISFVRAPIGWPLAALLGWFLYKLIAGTSWNWSPKLYLPAAALSLALLFVVGIPTGHSAWDWIKHWALINEIATHTWPVSVNLHGENLYLRYYLAAYLVPALIHKAIPLIPVVMPVALWFFFGYVLVFRVIGIAFKRRSLAIASAGMVLTIILTGADAFMRHFIGVFYGKPLIGWIGFHYYAWAGVMGPPLAFDSALSSLAWVPNQSIPVFIVAAMLLMDRHERSFARVLIAYGMLSLWSPYGMIGLLPLVLLRLIQHRKSILNPHTISAMILGTIFALLVASYLSTELPQDGGVCLACALRRTNEIGFLILFLVIELAAFVLLLRGKIFSDRYCAVALATLIFIPFFHGKTIDFVVRASMGPLFALALRSAERALDLRLTRTEPIPVALALALCLPTSVSEVAFHLEKGTVYHTASGIKMPEAVWTGAFSTSSGVTVTEFLDSCGWKYEPQYFSHTRAWILRPVSRR